MDRQKIKYVINLSWILLWAVLLSSCINDRFPATESATVKVTFMTKAIGNPTSEPGGLEANEHMRTLRVIVARTNGEILYNVYYDIAEEETSKTITFSELTVKTEGEDLDFYAIANEAGAGYDGDWGSIAVDGLKSIVMTDIGKLNDGTAMIPQTAHTTINVAPQEGGGMQSETIKLQFAVAKVRMTVINTSTDKQTVSDIKLSGVNTASTTLFPPESISTTSGGTVDLGNMEVPETAADGTEGTATVYAYFFENTGGTYMLTAKWGSVERTLNISGDPYNISGIKRGTELDIRVTLSNSTSPDFNVSVVPWSEKTIDVPAFE